LAAVQEGLVLTKVHRDVAPLKAALDTMLEHISSLTVSCESTPAQPHAGQQQGQYAERHGHGNGVLPVERHRGPCGPIQQFASPATGFLPRQHG
jgi:hypothetical protein